MSHLPSKKFLIRGGIATVVVASLLVAQTDWFRGLFHKDPLPKVADLTIGDLVGKDSNGNGVADWEEQLWGLDPTALYTNGTPNAEIIAQKKKVLGINDTPNEPLNDTDEVARRLFVLSSALGQSEEVSDSALQDAAQSLGSNIDVPHITNHYTSNDLTRVGSTEATLRKYYADMQNVFKNVAENTDEVAIITGALEAGDLTSLGQLSALAPTYTSTAEKIKAVKVPIGIAEQHLAMMNSLYGIGESFGLIAKLDTDGITGLSGLAAYKRFNDTLLTSISDIQQYLIRYGILSS